MKFSGIWPASAAMCLRLVLCLSIAVLLSAPGLYGQQANFGSIIGTVTDPAGAVIPGVKVTITSQQRGTVYNTTTNESGYYTQTHVDSGIYTVQFEAQGFQRFVQKDLAVSVDRSTRVDAAMKVGQLSEEITVTGAPPVLVADRAEVSTWMKRDELAQLPLLNRNLQSLQLIMPGSTIALGQHASSENPQGTVQVNSNGLRFGAQNFLIDGTDNNDIVLGIIMVNPTVDSVAEYKYTTSNYDAEYAQAGGAVIQVETKSGTNEFHGSLFEFLQNDKFKARNPFSEPKGPLPCAGTSSAALSAVRSEEQVVLFRRCSDHPQAHWFFPPDHSAHAGDAQRRLLGLFRADFRSANRGREWQRENPIPVKQD